jgi:exosortase family protein XrtM
VTVISYFSGTASTLWLCGTIERAWITYILLFLVIFGVLDYGYYFARGTFVEHLIIDKLTVRPAVAIIDTLEPTARATASGHSLLSPFGRINILQGCEGTEAMFLLIAAVLPFPVRWKAKLLGVGTGVLLMYAMNQLRILALFAALRWHRDWFSSLHGLIAPTFIVLVGCLFFFLWANAATTPSRA